MPPDLSLVSAPRIARPAFAAVLSAAHSPAAPYADSCYAAITAQGIDPAVGLAMFRHESGCGCAGVAARTRNWGNLRKSMGRAHHVADGWAWYSTWADGAADWALLMRAYVGRGVATVRAAIPVYAPPSDGNAPSAYIEAVLAAVASWQDAADPWREWGDTYPLPAAERGFAIPLRWAQDGNLGAATSEEIAVLVGAGRLFERGAILWIRASNATKVFR
jgi:hypothetical protein